MTLTIAAYVLLAGVIFGVAFWLKVQSEKSDETAKKIVPPDPVKASTSGELPSPPVPDANPAPETNAYSPKGKFLIEHLPDDFQSYKVWRMADVLPLGGRKARWFGFWTRAEADEFCRRKEGEL